MEIIVNRVTGETVQVIDKTKPLTAEEYDRMIEMFAKAYAPLVMERLKQKKEERVETDSCYQKHDVPAVG